MVAGLEKKEMSMKKIRVPDLNRMGMGKVVVAPPAVAPAIPAIQVAVKTPEAKPKADVSRVSARQALREALMARNAELSRLPRLRQAIEERNAVLDTQSSFQAGT